WFFNRSIAPVAPALPAETRRQMASVLDRCAEHLNALLEGALHWKPVRDSDEGIADSSLVPRPAAVPDALLAHGIPASILRRLVQDLRTATACHNALFANRKGLAGELVALWPAATGRPLLDAQSLRSSTKLVLILLLLLLEEGWLGFPGGSQVAFYATFF